MEKERVLRTAEFSPKVQTYWMLSGTISCIFLCLVLIGFVLLPIWLILGTMITGRFRESLSCTLTNRSLKFSRGIWVRTEKTVPLEKITDLGMMQGPVMRHFGLHTLTVETAGQSGPGSLLRLTGIADTVAFREAVLEQRDALMFENRVGTTTPPAEDNAETSSTSPPTPDTDTLIDIRDTLHRIESLLSRPQE